VLQPGVKEPWPRRDGDVRSQMASPNQVMSGLAPGIYGLATSKAWVAGTGPAM